MAYRLRRPIDRVLGFGSLLVLLGVVVGVPVALAAGFGWPLPHGLPSVGALGDALGRPLPDTFFPKAMALVCWCAWADIAVSVVVELAATRRHRTTTRHALLPAQPLVAALVGTALMLFPTVGRGHLPSRGDVLLRPAPIVRVMAVADEAPAPDVAALPPSGAVDAAPAPNQHPIYVVVRGDTLWDVAERHLGDPMRYPEIVELTHGHLQPDGRVLADPDWIYPGWELVLPADAVGLPSSATLPTTPAAPTPAGAAASASPAGGPAAPAPPEVAPTTTGAQDPEPAAPTTSSSTSSSTTSTTAAPPSLRVPGLPVPAAPTAAQLPPAPTTTAPGPSSPGPTPSGPPLPAAPRPERPLRSVTPSTPPFTLPNTQSAAAAPTTTEAAVAVNGESAAATRHDPHFPWVQGLLAAGVVATLESLRRRQLRHRRSGRRIRQPDSAGIDLETELRARAELGDAEALDIALRRMAAGLREDELAVPEIAGVVVSRAEIEVVLERPSAPAPTGFRLREGGRRWVCARRGLGAFVELCDQELAPLPALVTVGSGERGLVMVNLEAGGVVAVEGDAAAARQLLVAMALELATARWTDHVNVDVMGLDFGERQSLPRVRSRGEADVAQLLRRAQQTEALCEDSGSGSTLAGRVAAEGDWMNVTVLLAGEPLAPQDGWDLAALVAGRGRCGQVVVVAGAVEGARWHLVLSGDGTLSVPPLGLAVTAQRLSDDAAQAVVSEVLEVATDTTDVAPAPVAALPLGSAAQSASAAGAGGDPPPPAEEGRDCEAKIFGPGAPCIPGVTFERAVDLELAIRLVDLGATGAPADKLMFDLWPDGAPGRRPASGGGPLGLGERVSPKTWQNTVARTRRALGQASDGSEIFPAAGQGRNYGLRRIGSDYLRFRLWADHAERCISSAGRTAALRRALDVVGGRPYDTTLGYVWTAARRTQIQQEVLDVARELAALCLDARDPAGVRHAVAKGRAVNPDDDSEVLARYEMQAAHLDGDRSEVRAVRQRLQTRLGPEETLHPETDALYRSLVS